MAKFQIYWDITSCKRVTRRINRALPILLLLTLMVGSFSYTTRKRIHHWQFTPMGIRWTLLPASTFQSVQNRSVYDIKLTTSLLNHWRFNYLPICWAIYNFLIIRNYIYSNNASNSVRYMGAVANNTFLTRLNTYSLDFHYRCYLRIND